LIFDVGVSILLLLCYQILMSLAKVQAVSVIGYSPLPVPPDNNSRYEYSDWATDLTTEESSFDTRQE
jgi:hypothetical protein